MAQRTAVKAAPALGKPAATTTKASAKKAPAKPAGSAPARKPAAKKPAARKSAAPKTAAKKAPATKSSTGQARRKKTSPARAAAAPKRTTATAKSTRTAPASSTPRKAPAEKAPSRPRTSRAPMPQAMEVSYSGRIFRSRLEARWAILMDLLEINWDYEPSFYEVGPGLYYLPDFYLPDHQAWLEVKGAPYLDAGSMAKILAAVAGPMRIPLREAPYTLSEKLLLAGPLSRNTLGRPLHTLVSPAGPGKAALSYATFGPEGIHASAEPWGVLEATGVAKARRPVEARLKQLLEPAPAAEATPFHLAAAYRFAATAAFDDAARRLAHGNDYTMTSRLERRRAGRPLGLAA